MSTQEPQFSEEELRAIEAEMEKVTVDDVLLQTIVVAAQPRRPQGRPRRPPPGEAAAPSPTSSRSRQAVDGARALLPLVEPRHGEQLGPVRDALSRLQMFYAQRSGGGRRPPRRAGAARAGQRHGPGAELRPALGARGSSPPGLRAGPRVRLRALRRRPGLAVAFRFVLTQRGFFLG